MKLFKNWWINNNWRFWAFQWAWAGDPYAAVEVWQEYRYMLNPNDQRGLAELICEEYECDVDVAWRNPIVRLVFWIRAHFF